MFRFCLRVSSSSSIGRFANVANVLSKPRSTLRDRRCFSDKPANVPEKADESPFEWVVNNNSSQARDLLANERTFLAWFRVSAVRDPTMLTNNKVYL